MSSYRQYSKCKKSPQGVLSELQHETNISSRFFKRSWRLECEEEKEGEDTKTPNSLVVLYTVVRQNRNLKTGCCCCGCGCYVIGNSPTTRRSWEIKNYWNAYRNYITDKEEAIKHTTNRPPFVYDLLHAFLFLIFALEIANAAHNLSDVTRNRRYSS